MVDIALCIGSNNGDRSWYIRRMEEMLRDVLEPPIVTSKIMETEPVEVEEKQEWFLNRIIGGQFKRSAMELLNDCRKIEKSLGRRYKGLRKARTADVDILLYGTKVIISSVLTIPHPSILTRRFCLEGLRQIMPDALIGDSGKTVEDCYLSMKKPVRNQKLRFL